MVIGNLVALNHGA
jgi:fatty-acyl-CoA synthase